MQEYSKCKDFVKHLWFVAIGLVGFIFYHQQDILLKSRMVYIYNIHTYIHMCMFIMFTCFKLCYACAKMEYSKCTGFTPGTFGFKAILTA